jgi:hypothetical protein
MLLPKISWWLCGVGMHYFLPGIKTCKFPMMIREGLLEDFLGDFGPYFVFPCTYVFLVKALLVM